jgi:hypothetical protein
MGDSNKGLGVIEGAALVIIGIFAVVVAFWIFGWLAGVIWWAVKIAALSVILFLLVRWAYRRAVR